MSKISHEILTSALLRNTHSSTNHARPSTPAALTPPPPPPRLFFCLQYQSVIPYLTHRHQASFVISPQCQLLSKLLLVNSPSLTALFVTSLLSSPCTSCPRHFSFLSLLLVTSPVLVTGSSHKHHNVTFCGLRYYTHHSDLITRKYR